LDTLDGKTLVGKLNEFNPAYGRRIFVGEYVRTLEGICFVYNSVCFENVPGGVISEEGLKKMFKRQDHVFDEIDREKALHVNSFWYDPTCNGKTLRAMTDELGYPDTHKTHVQRNLDVIPHWRFGRLIVWCSNSLHHFQKTTGF
jgi:hypothetical protein